MRLQQILGGLTSTAPDQLFSVLAFPQKPRSLVPFPISYRVVAPTAGRMSKDLLYLKLYMA